MKELRVKDWMFQKIAREHKAPRVWSNKIDIVFGETEKALHCIMGSANYRVVTWIPKSQIEEFDIDDSKDSYASTIYTTTYDSAIDISNDIKSMYA